MSDMSRGAGEVPVVESVQVISLYDDDGHIVHQHVVCQFQGGRVVPEDEALDAARAQAAELGHAVERLRAAVSRDPTHAQSAHRIDVDSGQHVRVEEPNFRSRAQPESRRY